MNPPAVATQAVSGEAAGGSHCVLIVRTAGRLLTHELRDDRCVLLSRNVGEHVHTLAPGRYLIEVLLPGTDPLTRVLDLESGTTGLIELRIARNELYGREDLESYGAAEEPVRDELRILKNLQRCEVLSVSAEGRIRRVTEYNNYEVLSIEPGAGISLVELDVPHRGPRVLAVLPTTGTGRCERCWLLIGNRSSVPKLTLRIDHPAADATVLYLDAGRLDAASALVTSGSFSDDLVGDPLRLALAGCTHLLRGNHDAAQKSVDQLLTHHAWLPDGYSLLGEIQARSGNHSEAIRLFEHSWSLGFPVLKEAFAAVATRLGQYRSDGELGLADLASSESFRDVQGLALCVDWSRSLLTLRLPQEHSVKHPTMGDWATPYALEYSRDPLPATFVPPSSSFSAGLHFSERKAAAQFQRDRMEPLEAVQAYRTMYMSRSLDDRLIVLKQQNRAYFAISCAGHEAVQVAAASVLRPGKDWIFTYYRDRALSLGLGVRPYEMLLQAVGAAADRSGGRQMPAHFSDPKLNIVSNPSSIGANFSHAIGCAHAGLWLDPTADDVTLVSCGEGATAEGEFWESLNNACLDRLPVIFLVQDNGYAISMPRSHQIAGGSIGDLVRAFPRLLVKKVDGTDLGESRSALEAAVTFCREERGPALVHAHVVRLHSHSYSDDETLYRTSAEIEADRVRDPLPRYRSWLLESGLLRESELHQLEHGIDAEIQSMTYDALESEPSNPAEMTTYLYSETINPSGKEFESSAVDLSGTQTVDAKRFSNPLQTMVDVINLTLEDEMARDSRIVIFGEDVADAVEESNLDTVKGKGGIFKVTRGLQRRFGSQRCFNTPITEATTVGRAIGMALRGMKPIVEIQFLDHIWRAMLQIRNELASIRWRSLNAYSCPVVIRVPCGGYLNGGALFHSQSAAGVFAGIPGLRVVMPSTAVDAAGLLRTAIRSDDPVIFLEHKKLYRETYNRGAYPGPEYMIPFGRARVVQPGASLTIVTYGALTQKSVMAAREIEGRDSTVSVEVIDLRSLNPYDWEAISSSVRKTSRVMVVYEDWKSWGYGAELVARISGELFGDLDAPVGRVATSDCWIGYQPELERQALAQVEDIATEAERILAY